MATDTRNTYAKKSTANLAAIDNHVADVVADAVEGQRVLAHRKLKLSSLEIDAPSSRRLITMRHVCAKTSYSNKSIYRLIKAGTFPKAVPLGPMRVAWVEVEVDAWIEARITKRDEIAL